MVKILIKTTEGNYIKQTNTSVNNTINNLYKSLNDEEIKFLFLEDIFIHKKTIVTLKIIEEANQSSMVRINQQPGQHCQHTI